MLLLVFCQQLLQKWIVFDAVYELTLTLDKIGCYQASHASLENGLEF